jgi:transposase
VDSSFAAGRKKRRPNYSSDFRKSLAQQACEPGISVSQLAQTNDINVNMLFKWRRQLIAGGFDLPAPAPPQVMLPVTIVETSAVDAPTAPAKRPANSAGVAVANVGAVRHGVIEIQIGEMTVRFDGHADLATLRAVVRMLRT